MIYASTGVVSMRRNNVAQDLVLLLTIGISSSRIASADDLSRGWRWAESTQIDESPTQH